MEPIPSPNYMKFTLIHLDPKPKNNLDEGSKFRVQNGPSLIFEGVRYVVCCVGLNLSLNKPRQYMPHQNKLTQNAIYYYVNKPHQNS